MFFSAIVPLYNRPQEIQELLDSLLHQTYKNFEVIVVEDGSKQRAEKIVASFQNQLNVHYYYKENTGPGFTRNYGMERAKGDFWVIFDSDCLIPPEYFEVLKKAIEARNLDAFGGPDRAHPAFNTLQKAISYSMTSFFTTGGIRGSKQHIGVFHPRSFNMGLKPIVFEATKGFLITRLGEDIDFSIRIIEKGFKTELVPEAFVYHKRRSTLKQFFRQVSNFGKARINLYLMHGTHLKITYWFPALYLLYIISLVVSICVLPQYVLLLALPIIIYWGAILLHCLWLERSVAVAFLSVITSNTQLLGYGSGFLSFFIQKIVLGKK